MTEETCITVALASDNTLLKLIVNRLLETHLDVHLIGTVSTEHEYDKLMGEASHQPQVLLLDQYGNLEQAISEITQAMPNTNVIVLSPFPKYYRETVLKAGAAEYVDLANLFDELIPAIRHCMRPD